MRKIERAIKAKGIENFKVQKVKAHQTKKQKENKMIKRTKPER